jgi:hypothetical protein
MVPLVPVVPLRIPSCAAGLLGVVDEVPLVPAWPAPYPWLDWANAPALASIKAPINANFFMVFLRWECA